MKKLLGLIASGTMVFVGVQLTEERKSEEMNVEILKSQHVMDLEHAAALDSISKGNVIDVSVGRAYTLMLTEDNCLYATGENDYGQLGDGTTSSRSTWGLVHNAVDNAGNTEWRNCATEDNGGGLMQIEAGFRNSGIITMDNNAIVWGQGGYGINTINWSGHTGATTNQTTPYFYQNANYQSAGDLSISRDSIYNRRVNTGTFTRVGGENVYGKLGLGHSTDIGTWTTIANGQDAEDPFQQGGGYYQEIIGSRYSAVAVSNDGRLYATGHYGLGRQSDPEWRNQVYSIPGDDTSGTSSQYNFNAGYFDNGAKITGVKRFDVQNDGLGATAFITEDNTIYSFGAAGNANGLINDSGTIEAATAIDDNPEQGFINGRTEITDIAVGESAMQFVDGDNNIWGVGSGGSNALNGHADTTQAIKIVDAAELDLEFGDSIVEIDNYYNTLSVRTDSGKLLMFGANDNGEMGLGHYSSQTLTHITGGYNVQTVTTVNKGVIEKEELNSSASIDYTEYFKVTDHVGDSVTVLESELSWKDGVELDTSKAGKYTLTYQKGEWADNSYYITDMVITVTDRTAPTMPELTVRDRHDELVTSDDMTYTEVKLYVEGGTDISQHETKLYVDGESVDFRNGYAIDIGGNYDVRVETYDIYGNKSVLNYDLVMSKAVGSNIGPTAMGFIMVGGIMMLVIGAMWLNVKMAPRKMNYDGSWYS